MVNKNSHEIWSHANVFIEDKKLDTSNAKAKNEDAKKESESEATGTPEFSRLEWPPTLDVYARMSEGD